MLSSGQEFFFSSSTIRKLTHYFQNLVISVRVILLEYQTALVKIYRYKNIIELEYSYSWIALALHIFTLLYTNTFSVTVIVTAIVADRDHEWKEEGGTTSGDRTPAVYFRVPADLYHPALPSVL